MLARITKCTGIKGPFFKVYDTGCSYCTLISRSSTSIIFPDCFNCWSGRSSCASWTMEWTLTGWLKVISFFPRGNGEWREYAHLAVLAIGLTWSYPVWLVFLFSCHLAPLLLLTLPSEQVMGGGGHSKIKSSELLKCYSATGKTSKNHFKINCSVAYQNEHLCSSM